MGFEMSKEGRNQIIGVVRGLERFAELAIKKVTLDIHANLVSAPQQGGTPVDTGWASSNWVPNIGVPFRNTDGTPENLSTSSRETGVAAVAAQYTLDRGPVFISNNVPYITDLNNGHSRQAPKNFVQRAILRAIAMNQTLRPSSSGGTVRQRDARGRFVRRTGGGPSRDSRGRFVRRSNP